jgi:hypothetical protein
MAEDEERLCAFLSKGASRSSYMANDNINLGPVDKLIGPEAGSGDVYEAEIAC